MKKLLFVFAFAFILSMGAASAATDIHNWTELQGITANMSEDYNLVANLSSADADYAGIGNSWWLGVLTYSGTFEGNGNSIDDLVTSTPGDFTGRGFIATLGAGGVIQNLNMDSPDINCGGNGWPCGSIVRASSGTIDNVHVTNGDVAGSSQGTTGGLVGDNDGTISDSSYNGVVTGGGSRIGGVAGRGSGTITSTLSSGSITCTGPYCGGIWGMKEGTFSSSNSSMTVSGTSQVGGLIGWSQAGAAPTNCNCYATGNVTGSSSSVGGAIGQIDHGASYIWATGYVSSTGGNNVGGAIGDSARATYEYIYATGDVYAPSSSRVGGLFGTTSGGRATIRYSYATGNVEGNTHVGGFCGDNSQNAIYDSYATGDVVGNQYVGGFGGYFDELSAYGDVDRVYAKGNVTGTTDVGGLFGWTEQGFTSCANSFWDTETSGQATDNCTGSAGKTTAEMADTATFTTWSIAATDTQINTYYPWFDYQSDTDSGTTWFLSNGPTYNITDCYELQSMQFDPHGSYQLMNDINCTADGIATWNSGGGFIPIGSPLTGDGSSFSGELDGNGFNIEGFRTVVGSLPAPYGPTSATGMFQTINATGYVHDFTMTNFYASGWGAPGGITVVNQGTIEKVGVQGTLNCAGSTNTQAAGGIAAYNQGAGIINQSYFNGGASGYCYRNSGGIAGWNQAGTIVNVWTNWNPNGFTRIGSIIGNNDALLQTSYTTRSTTNGDTGGTNTNVLCTSAGTCSGGGTAYTSGEMQTKSTYENENFVVDGDVIWRVPNLPPAYACFPWDENCGAFNEPPVIDVIPDSTTVVWPETDFSAQFGATDPEGEPLTWSQNGSALLFNISSSGLLYSIGTLAEDEQYDIWVTVEDNNSFSDSVSYLVTVLPQDTIGAICADGEFAMGDAAGLAGMILAIILVASVLGMLTLSFTGVVDLKKLESSVTIDKLPGAVLIIGVTFLLLATMAYLLGAGYCGALS